MEVFKYFFTHKDFLPPASELPGTLFTPLHIVFCLLLAILVGFASVYCSKKDESYQNKIFFVLWLLMFISEPLITYYDCCKGATVQFYWDNVLPLWPCSIFLYTAPFAFFGKGKVQYAAYGYICTLGLLGGLVNFVYPANYLSYYSCISLAGFRTLFYHGSMVFVAITILLSNRHSFKGIQSLEQVLLPIIPALIVSIPANIANYLIPNADYMFFKMESFFFAPIGYATPDWFTLILVYIVYFIIHCGPYLPSYLKNRENN